MSNHADHLPGGEDLVVAMAPAEPRQIIAQALRKEAHGPVGLDAERAMPLGELGPVGAVDQRDMGHDRHLPAHGLVDLRLSGRVGEVIDAPDHMGDAHVVIVHDDGELIGRRAVAAQR